MAALLSLLCQVRVSDSQDPEAALSSSYSFRGDAVLTNGRIRLVAGRGGITLSDRVRILPMGANPQIVNLVQTGKNRASIEAAGVRLSLARDEVFVQIEPAGASKVRFECAARYVVMPDFFADDILIDPSKLPGGAKEIEIPSENFLLHMLEKNDAIAICVFENRDQDARIILSQGAIAGSEIEFGKRKIWIGLIEGPNVWHSTSVAPADAGKIRKLDWKMPFAAQWRVDYTRADGLTDSWEMLLQEKEGGDYVKPGWLGQGSSRIKRDRMRWTTVLGDFPYPAWSDPDGRGYLQPLDNDALKFAGPVVLYPINRMPKTPVEMHTTLDLVRKTLGVGPCEYILDLEGQKSQYRGMATCETRDTLRGIYEKGRQKAEHARVDKILDQALAFVTHIRSRITLYTEFGRKIRGILAERKKEHPELAEPIGELEKVAGELSSRYAAREEKIKTPQYVADMNARFRKDILPDEGPDALKKCKEYGEALVEVGDNQDELSGECRWVIRALRQRAGILQATDPRMAPVAKEIRTQTQEILRNPAHHEGAHH